MFKLAFRYIKSNLRSSFRAVFGIAFSIMLMFSLIQISGCIMDQFRGLVTSGLHRDLTVYDLTCEELIRLHGSIVNEPLSGTQREVATIWIGDIYESDIEAYKLIGTEGDLDYFKSTGIITGAYPQADGEVCIEKSYADNKGLSVGDSIELTVTFSDAESFETVEMPVELTVSGILRDLVDDGTYFITSLEGAARIIAESGVTNDPRSNSIAYETIEGGFDSDEMIAAAEGIKQRFADISPERAEHFYAEHYFDNEYKLANYDEKGTFTETSAGIAAISVVIAVCMVIFVYNTLNISLLQKLDNLAVMRCIGLNNRQLGKMVAAEAVLLTAVSYVIGCAAGNVLNLFVARKLVGALIAAGDTGAAELSQSPLLYGAVLILAFISAFIACARLISKFRKMKPVNITKFGSSREIKEDFSRDGLSKKAYDLGFAMRNIKRNFTKSITQVVTVSLSYILCFVICNTFLTIGLGSTKSIEDICDHSIQADIVNSDTWFTDEDIEVLKEFCSPKKIYTQKAVWQFLESSVGEESVQPMVYSDGLAQIFAENAGLSYDSGSEFAVLMGDGCDGMTELDAVIGGEQVTIPLTAALNRELPDLRSVIIGGTVVLIMNEKTADILGCNMDCYASVQLTTDEKLLHDELSAVLGAEKEFRLVDMNEGKEQSKQMLLGIVALAAYIVMATILLSFMIIGNTIRENAVSRKREFGIMCSIPEHFHDWGWFNGSGNQTITFDNISETLDINETVAYVDGNTIHLSNVSGNEASPFSYDEQKGELTLILEPGSHRVGLLLVDKAGNSKSVREVQHLAIGNYRIWIGLGSGIGAILLAVLAVFGVKKFKRRRLA